MNQIKISGQIRWDWQSP